MMIHTTPRPEDKLAGVGVSNNGCVVKTIRYIGKAAHAGGAPHMGINALYAANIALTAINALRETFREHDTIRVHPIITQGGIQVNVIPADVRLETYVRAGPSRPSWKPTPRSTVPCKPERWRLAPKSRSRPSPAICHSSITWRWPRSSRRMLLRW